MKRLFFAIAVLFLGCSAHAQDAGKLLSNYITVKNALVNGDARAVSQALVNLQLSLEENREADQKKVLHNAILTMAKAGKIDKQREAFNDVSTNLWKVLKRSESGEPVYYQYCPMKKAYWLSKEKEIRNPYYGAAMLVCGKIVETK